MGHTAEFQSYFCSILRGGKKGRRFPFLGTGRGLDGKGIHLPNRRVKMERRREGGMRFGGIKGKGEEMKRVNLVEYGRGKKSASLSPSGGGGRRIFISLKERKGGK